MGRGRPQSSKCCWDCYGPRLWRRIFFGLGCIRQDPEVLRRTGSLIKTPVFYEHLSARENLYIHLAYLEAEVDPQEAGENFLDGMEAYYLQAVGGGASHE